MARPFIFKKELSLQISHMTGLVRKPCEKRQNWKRKKTKICGERQRFEWQNNSPLIKAVTQKSFYSLQLHVKINVWLEIKKKRLQRRHVAGGKVNAEQKKKRRRKEAGLRYVIYLMPFLTTFRSGQSLWFSCSQERNQWAFVGTSFNSQSIWVMIQSLAQTCKSTANYCSVWKGPVRQKRKCHHDSPKKINSKFRAHC